MKLFIFLSFISVSAMLWLGYLIYQNTAESYLQLSYIELIFVPFFTFLATIRYYQIKNQVRVAASQKLSFKVSMVWWVISLASITVGVVVLILMNKLAVFNAAQTWGEDWSKMNLYAGHDGVMAMFILTPIMGLLASVMMFLFLITVRKKLKIAS